MNHRSSHEPYLDWEIGGRSEQAQREPEETIVWEVDSVRANSGQDTIGVPLISLAGADPAAHFTLHPDALLRVSGLDPESGPDANAATLTPSALAEKPIGLRTDDDTDHPRMDFQLKDEVQHPGGVEATSDGSARPFPRRGDGIGGFRLISELGRGAFGRVFLAEEVGLGNRAVALKISRAEGDEPRYLARLQHTHIVPIYSVHADPATGLRLMCMPYLCGANLAQALEAAGTMTAEAGPTTRGVPRSLIDALDYVGHPAIAEPTRMVGSSRPSSCRSSHSGEHRATVSSHGGEGGVPDDHNDPAQPARRFLRQASSIRAAVWITARLAEGLEHAHSRGLLHRDLKPSNILIAADGTPMLLDFNLAAAAPGPEGATKALMGGTLPYMAPEHLDAFNPKGSTSPDAVDERSDLYSLGLILFEMIAGKPPFPGPAPGVKLIDAVATMTEERRREAPSLRAVCPEVPWSLESIIRTCLDPDPDRRHDRAGDLAEDLRRFLDDQPLRFAPEPSFREQVAKWARRNPKYVGATPVALLSLFLLAAVGGSAWSLSQHLDRVSSRLSYRVFQHHFQDCQLRLGATLGHPEPLDQGIDSAEKTLEEAMVEDRGHGRGRSWVDALDPEDREETRLDLTELILLVVQARVFRANRTHDEGLLRRTLEEAVSRLDAIEQRDPAPPRALFANRASYLAALGDAERAARDEARRDAMPPRTGRDFYMIGTTLLAEGKVDQAEQNLHQAVLADPRRFWSWFMLGLCHYQQGRFPAASSEFAICSALAPKYAWPWMNRGLALSGEGRLIEARDSYTQALKLEPNFAEALVNRGIVKIALNDPTSIEDFRQAIALGRDEPKVQTALAEALARHGHLDEAMTLFAGLIEKYPENHRIRVVRGMVLIRTQPQQAEADFRFVLSQDRKYALAWLGLARVLRKTDPTAALQAVDTAIGLDDSRLDAIELRAWLRGSLGMPEAVEDVNRLIAQPTRDRLFNGACALALLQRSRPSPNVEERALALLRRAIELGLSIEAIRNEPDLEAIRASAGYLSLAGR